MIRLGAKTCLLTGGVLAACIGGCEGRVVPPPGITVVSIGETVLWIESDFVHLASSDAVEPDPRVDTSEDSAFIVLPAEVAATFLPLTVHEPTVKDITLVITPKSPVPFGENPQAREVVELLSQPMSTAVQPIWAQKELGDLRLFRKSKLEYVMTRMETGKPVYLASCVELRGRDGQGPDSCHRQFDIDDIHVRAEFSEHNAVSAEAIEASVKCLIEVWRDLDVERLNEARLERCAYRPI